MKFTYSSGQRPLDGYTLKRGVGRGGFGEVYYAVSDGGKEVALKFLQGNQDIELRGVIQCLNLKHPNLVGLYDLKTDAQGESWVVMEYIAGEPLSAVIQRHPQGLPIELARQWFLALAKAIAYLHDHGIVHRDLKPGNIFIESGVVKVGDYGLSKFISGSRRTAQTQSIGTVHYMAPEISTGNYNKQIDIYAAGVIFYEMLTGRVPFDGESTGEILMKHLTSPPDLSQLPAACVPIVAKALSKNPAHRYSSMAEMARAIEALVEKPNHRPAAASAGFAPPRSIQPAPEPSHQAVEKPAVAAAPAVDRHALPANSLDPIILGIARRWMIFAGLLVGLVTLPRHWHHDGEAVLYVGFITFVFYSMHRWRMGDRFRKHRFSFTMSFALFFMTAFWSGMLLFCGGKDGLPGAFALMFSAIGMQLASWVAFRPLDPKERAIELSSPVESVLNTIVLAIARRWMIFAGILVGLITLPRHVHYEGEIVPYVGFFALAFYSLHRWRMFDRRRQRRFSFTMSFALFFINIFWATLLLVCCRECWAGATALMLTAVIMQAVSWIGFRRPDLTKRAPYHSPAPPSQPTPPPQRPVRSEPIPLARPIEEPILNALPAVTLRGQIAELSASMALTALFALFGGILWAALGEEEVANISTVFFLTVAACWAVLIPAQWWTARRGDSWNRRWMMMLLGIILGLGALWLDGWTPCWPVTDTWLDASSENMFVSLWPADRSLTEAASRVSYFALVFFALRWWKIADRRRPKRFSFAPLFAAGFWGLVPLIIWPQAWMGAVALVMAAAIVQLVSPWEESPPRPLARRLRLRCCT